MIRDKEVSEYMQKLLGECPYCHKRHAIAVKNNIPFEQLRKRKLEFLPCHLRHSHYVGSFITKDNIVVDVFDVETHSATIEITLTPKGKEKFEETKESTEEEELDEMLEEESWEQIYIYEDMDAEEELEENC